MIDVIWILYFALYFLFAGALFRLFQKARINHTWFAFVPVLSTIGQLRVIGKSGWNVLWYLVPFANLVFGIMWMVQFLRAFGKSGWWILWSILPIGDAIFAVMFLIWGYGSKTQFVGVSSPAMPRNSDGESRGQRLRSALEKASQAAKSDPDYPINIDP